MAEDKKPQDSEQTKNTGEKQPVDQKAQEDAAKEREKTGGYE